MTIQINELNKSYGTKHALKDFNAIFTPGVYALLGPNGAGKTTLINMLVDNLKPDKGEVLCDGNNIITLGGQWRKKIGFMPQQQQVYQNMSSERFMFYIAALKGLEREEAKNQIDKLFATVNLKDEKRKKLGALSGGMKQRILIAQALLGNPEILILDEPTAGLDPKERVRMKNLISSLSKDMIIIIATHIVSDVEAIADEVLFLREGELIAKGSMIELSTQLNEEGVTLKENAGLEDLYIAFFGDDWE
ncbi:MAG: ATP-binding cassette domain-containing protein [Oscillospiraceae bacterium]|nr:ATP-binding cassette domain-containing protein [Oscillospiraceae bacterium]